ncbi:glycosyltransferase family 4 protein [Aliarcobacter butzleri]|uniref:glycosyltransferase family 4 protein n=1 Tax=Aliarcobacter butzleri TaxID=28197 RepID=UPI0012600985|nr:glycosyltransferase family 4 protein [Aliarcobacter butzleri]MCT7551049.1 glycosyltransferase family 4 protein [Aliarcobacter butzleri]MCT7560019.1 glycosyltransferase family 4 protein [Aliarcobacter butzleri]MCT7636420.1 glycosyltransferase family 4 protein [Aliarcobacter butzleri]
MRILVLSFYYFPDLCAGSFRTTSFIEELKKQITLDDEVEIITSMPNRYGSFSQEAKEFEKLTSNIKINRLDLGSHKSGFIDQSKLFLKFIWKVFKLIRQREKYDIVYATSSRLMTGFLGSLIANRQKAKLYLDIRDIFTDTLESIFAKSKLRYVIPIFRKIEKYTINYATHINLVSKGFEKYFRNINNNISYSFYTNGIDDVFLDYDFTKLIENKKKIITYAGNIGEGQGLEKIIPDMSKKLGEDYEIHIIGDGGRKKALIENLKEVNNVKLFNPVNRSKLLEIYKNSDILFLHLNNYEAFRKVLPSKLFEYATTNKFIIAGVSGYAKEFIEENISDSIVFEPCNVNNFYEKFEKVQKFDNINRVSFIENFKRENIMEKMAKEVYKL